MKLWVIAVGLLALGGSLLAGVEYMELSAELADAEAQVASLQSQPLSQVTVEETITEVVTERITEAPTPPGPVATPSQHQTLKDVYLAPDPAFARQLIRRWFDTKLGREPGENEFRHLVGAYLAVHEDLYDDGRRGMDLGVAAESRLYEYMEDRYSAEIAGERQEREAAEAEENYRESNECIEREVRGEDC